MGDGHPACGDGGSYGCSLAGTGGGTPQATDATADEIVCVDAYAVYETLASGDNPTAALRDGETLELILAEMLSVEYLIGDVDDAHIAPAVGDLHRVVVGAKDTDRSFGEYMMDGVDAVTALRDACADAGYEDQLTDGGAAVRACYQLRGLEATIANPGQLQGGALDGRIQAVSQYLDWRLSEIEDDELRSAATRLSTSVASRDYDAARTYSARGAERCEELGLGN